MVSNQSLVTAPYSHEAEEAVIGAVLINPDSFLSVSGFLTAADFFFTRHSQVWQAMQRLHERKEPIDLITLADELQAMGVSDSVDSLAFLTQTMRNTPTSIYVEVYGRMVERAAIRRKLMEAADQIKALAIDEQAPIEAIIVDAESALFNVTDRQVKREFIPMRDAVGDYFDRIEHLMNHQDEPLGLPSGFNDLDTLLGGFQKSDLIIFAGRPGMGKTSFLLSTAVNAARNGARVAIFTMEMGTDQLIQRMISMETGINSQKLRAGKLEQQEYNRFVTAAGRISNFPIFIDDTPALSPAQIRTKCRRLQHEHGIDIIFVDYIQLMNAGGQYNNNRVQEVSYISRHLKELARELNVPVFSAAQLSRAVEQRQDKRPVLSDLRESGSLEQDADIVMFLYRDSVYNEAAEFPNQADILISKHRNGPVGTVSLYFDRTITKFLDGVTHQVDLREAY